jgi:hypothetical protein
MMITKHLHLAAVAEDFSAIGHTAEHETDYFDGYKSV